MECMDASTSHSQPLQTDSGQSAEGTEARTTGFGLDHWRRLEHLPNLCSRSSTIFTLALGKVHKGAVRRLRQVHASLQELTFQQSQALRPPELSTESGSQHYFTSSF